MRRLLLVVILVAACGDDSNRHIMDAPLVQPDVPIADAPPSPVTLTVSQNGTPVMSVVTYFQSSDSHLVSATSTDATGVASAVLGAGGIVTALDPFPQVLGVPSHTLYTFAGVKPGDHLLLTNKTTVVSQISVTFTLPLSGGANVSQYTITMTCADAKYPVAIYSAAVGTAATVGGLVSLYQCTDPVDVVVAAESASGQPVEYFQKTNQTFTDQEVVDWSAEPYTAAAPRDYTYTNVPASVSSFGMTDFSASTRGLDYASYGGLVTTGTTTTMSEKVPDYTGAVDVVLTDVQTSTYALHHFLDWAPYAPAFTTDITARMLPEFTAIPVQSTTSPSNVTWTETTAGVAPDFVVGNLYTYRATDGRAWNWHFVAPYTSGTYTLPVLPTDVYDYNIATTDSFNINELNLAKVPGGYDAVRANVFNITNPIDLTSLSATGSIVIEEPQSQLAIARQPSWGPQTTKPRVLRNRHR